VLAAEITLTNSGAGSVSAGKRLAVQAEGTSKGTYTYTSSTLEYKVGSKYRLVGSLCFLQS
jgi:hypothetical protein